MFSQLRRRRSFILFTLVVLVSVAPDTPRTIPDEWSKPVI